MSPAWSGLFVRASRRRRSRGRKSISTCRLTRATAMCTSSAIRTSIRSSRAAPTRPRLRRWTSFGNCLLRCVSSASSSCSRASTVPTTRARSTACVRLESRARSSGDRRQDDRCRTGRDGQSRHSRDSPEPCNRRHQRSVGRAPEIRQCRRPGREAGLAYSIQHAATGHRSAQPAVSRVGRAARHRSLRWRDGGARARPTRLWRARESGEIGQSVCEDLRQRRFRVDAT